MEVLSMEVIDGAMAVLKAENPESVMHYTLLQALQELREFKELGLSVDQLREIDRLYAEKCREVVERHERDIEKGPQGCGHDTETGSR